MLGKFVMIEDGDSFRTGEVTAVHGEFLLVQFDDMCPGRGVVPMPAGLYHLTEAAAMAGDMKAWSVFPSREKLQAYLDWLNSPARPQVVSLVRK